MEDKIPRWPRKKFWITDYNPTLGEKIECLADLEIPSEEDLNSQLLCYEPDVLNVKTGLPTIDKSKFKQGVYY